MQAANSADFAVAQFRYLRELLLVQGRNMYRRQTTLVCYVFYKSIMMVLTTFWFFAFTASSGQKFGLEIGVQVRVRGMGRGRGRGRGRSRGRVS